MQPSGLGLAGSTWQCLHLIRVAQFWGTNAWMIIPVSKSQSVVNVTMVNSKPYINGKATKTVVTIPMVTKWDHPWLLRIVPNHYIVTNNI